MGRVYFIYNVSLFCHLFSLNHQFTKLLKFTHATCFQLECGDDNLGFFYILALCVGQQVYGLIKILCENFSTWTNYLI